MRDIENALHFLTFDADLERLWLLLQLRSSDYPLLLRVSLCLATWPGETFLLLCREPFAPCCVLSSFKPFPMVLVFHGVLCVLAGECVWSCGLEGFCRFLTLVWHLAMLKHFLPRCSKIHFVCSIRRYFVRVSLHDGQAALWIESNMNVRSLIYGFVGASLVKTKLSFILFIPFSVPRLAWTWMSWHQF